MERHSLMVDTISRDELKEKIDWGDDFYLVEVLDEPYYRHSHLPGAINLPPGSVGEAPHVLPDKKVEIVVYCMDPPWTKSEEAARELVAMGYENVREYAGGKQDWMRVGLPVEREHREELAGTGRGNEEAHSWTVDRIITLGVIVILVLAFVLLFVVRLF